MAKNDVSNSEIVNNPDCPTIQTASEKELRRKLKIANAKVAQLQGNLVQLQMEVPDERRFRNARTMIYSAISVLDGHDPGATVLDYCQAALKAIDEVLESFSQARADDIASASSEEGML